MHQPDPICPICRQAVPTAVPVIFDHGEIVHLDCYVGTEGETTVVRAFLEARSHERFCYTCLAQRLIRDRQGIEKAATALRLNQSVVVEPGVCSVCTQTRVTIQARPAP
jgi:hypothetical protein